MPEPLLAIVASSDGLRPPPVQSPVPFPRFTDLTADGKRGFVQYWPERDCVVSLEFLRAVNPSAHARWWLREALFRTGERSEYPVGFVIKEDLENSPVHPWLRQRMLNSLAVMPEPGCLKEEAGRLGYVQDPTSGRFIRVAMVERAYASPEALCEKRGESREIVGSIPEPYDPRIFFEHPPTQSPLATRERMRAEGEQDAECVRRYLFAYQRFMDCPTVANLFDATISPHFGDSYNLAMRHCLEAGVSDDFISLIHVTFALQWVMDSRPLTRVVPPPGSRGLLPEDVDLMASAIQRYCQGQVK